jgi:hypothetical protein
MNNDTGNWRDGGWRDVGGRTSEPPLMSNWRRPVRQPKFVPLWAPHHHWIQVSDRSGLLDERAHAAGPEFHQRSLVSSHSNLSKRKLKSTQGMESSMFSIYLQDYHFPIRQEFNFPTQEPATSATSATSSLPPLLEQNEVQNWTLGSAFFWVCIRCPSYRPDPFQTAGPGIAHSVLLDVGSS